MKIENAQICSNLGGTQTCHINNINPTTNEFSPTNIDLASQEPAGTTAPTASTALTTSTTEPTAPTESTESESEPANTEGTESYN